MPTRLAAGTHPIVNGKRHRSTPIYRAEKKSWQILLSWTQAEPGRKVKEEQAEISRNHVPRLFLSSVALRRSDASSIFW